MKKSLITCLLLLSPFALAQAQSDAKQSREREQLRRSQAALQAAQSKAESLGAENATLLRERDDLVKEAARQKASSRGFQQQREQLRVEVDRHRDEALALATRLKEQELAATQREEQLQQQLLASNRELVQIRQSNLALSTLLERSNQQLLQAQARNTELHALGQQALDLWLGKTVAEATVQQDPLLGLAHVAMQEKAESMRLKLDGQRLPRSTSAQ
ncbi:MAG: hypothetical protein ACOVRJ_06180 [Roseateles sp.]